MYGKQAKIVFRDKRPRVAWEITPTSFSYIYYDPPPSTAHHTLSLPTNPHGRLNRRFLLSGSNGKTDGFRLFSPIVVIAETIDLSGP